MTDYIAARIDDPLIHSSALADFVGAVVEGAIIAGIIFFRCRCNSGRCGDCRTGPERRSGKIGDAAGKLVDSLIDPGPPDAHIVTGSENVHIKGKKSRACRRKRGSRLSARASCS